MDNTKAYNEGANHYGEKAAPKIQFLSCSKNPNTEDISECLTGNELIEWTENVTQDGELRASLINSFNFVDFEATDEPLKRGLTVGKSVDILKYETQIQSNLQMNFVSFEDTLINPIEFGDAGDSDFFSVESTDYYKTEVEEVDTAIPKRRQLQET